VPEPGPPQRSGVATLAYDCRRTAYFTEQLYATLTLIDRGILLASTRGSMHGEIGHTQFLPKSILNYGTGGNLDVVANALSSTANFLRGHGWRAGAGYQPGQTNFGAIQAWNAPLSPYTGPSRDRRGWRQCDSHRHRCEEP
jgi:membrane-bound lytic murein transglycosylase B